MLTDFSATLYWKSEEQINSLSIVETVSESAFFKLETKRCEESFFTKFALKILLTAAYAPDIRYKASFRLVGEKIIKVLTPFPHFNHKSLSITQYVIETDKRSILLRCDMPFPFEVRQTGSSELTVDLIIDAPFLHPAWDLSKGQRISSAAPRQPVGTVYNFSYSVLYFPGKSFIPIQQYIYPFGKKAAFMLTDHCDFDSAQKLRLFLYGNSNDGWLGRGLKITKGVFTLAPKPGEPRKNDSLEDSPYAEYISALYKDGSEIAPHALKSKGQLSSVEFHQAIEKLVAIYHPGTWIDHGSYLKYCYSQGAKENPAYRLIDTLQKHGFNNLWSYHDVNTDALNTLNIFSTSTNGITSITTKIVKYIFTGKWLIAAHYIRSIFHRGYRKSIIRHKWFQ